MKKQCHDGAVAGSESPSLKSIAASGPYMHEGRLATLGQVVDHYVRGVQAGPALDNRLRGPNGAPQRLALSFTDGRLWLRSRAPSPTRRSPPTRGLRHHSAHDTCQRAPTIR